MSDRFGSSYAVIKNIRRRRENSAAALAAPDLAGDVEASKFLATSGPNDSDPSFITTSSNASTASPGSPLDFEKAFYSASNLEDDFNIFLNDPLTPQTLPSLTASVGDSTDMNTLTSTIDSDSHCTTLVPSSDAHTRNGNSANTPSAEKHMPDSMDGSFASSLSLEDLPTMELDFTNDGGKNAQYELLWESQNESLGDAWTSAAIEGLTTETANYPTLPLSIDSALDMVEVKKVSLVLEDMQPEMANRVTSLLLNSNVDVKMKMTVQ